MLQSTSRPEIVPTGLEVYRRQAATVDQELHVVQNNLLRADGRPRAEPWLSHGVLQIGGEHLIF